MSFGGFLVLFSHSLLPVRPQRVNIHFNVNLELCHEKTNKAVGKCKNCSRNVNGHFFAHFLLHNLLIGIYMEECNVVTAVLSLLWHSGERTQVQNSNTGMN